MSTKPASLPDSGFTTSAPDKSNIRWFVCVLLFPPPPSTTWTARSSPSSSRCSTTLPSWAGIFSPTSSTSPSSTTTSATSSSIFQIAYGVGFLFAGRIIDKLGTKTGYALAIGIWALSSMSHSLVTSVAGFCIARVFLGLGESGNFPAAIKAISEWFPTEERAKAVGLFNSGSNASAFIAPAPHRLRHRPLRLAAPPSSPPARSASSGSSSGSLFPYNKLRRGSTQTQQQPRARHRRQARSTASSCSHPRHSTPSPSAKASPTASGGSISSISPSSSTATTASHLADAYWYIVTVYLVSSVGSIFGGSLSGWLMKRGTRQQRTQVRHARHCALCVLPVVFVPHMSTLFPTNAWPATLLIALAAAAHQGWSAPTSSPPLPTCSPPPPSPPSSASAAQPEQLGGAAFTWIVKHNLSLHPCSSSPWPHVPTSLRSPSSSSWFRVSA